MIKRLTGGTKVPAIVKRLKHIYPTSLVTLGLGVLCTSLYCHQTQKDDYNKTSKIYKSYQRELKYVEHEVAFLEKNQSQLNFLIKKGWFIPRSRLIVGAEIHQLGAPLNALRFRIEPETIKEMEGKYGFKVSRIVIETDALLDNHIYDLSENILKNFPGVLMLRKLLVSRNKKVTRTHLLDLQQNKRPNFVIGELIFEWFSMREKKDEE